ncbi:isocitrate/isopropylmalate dehydrogenase family protein [Clostridium sp. Cult1]|uniref:isocitrate/isopropylmalate dehydrogenase family protein n=1 Tax=Clostridium sp. Cult1 TaxID=2079002 RepID=UPI001F23A7EF|nr:isocitrate/isopropylmalate dehydrogenase family protein [Clostridium sp. Cult1]MCF6463236.1 isocitrate dehydrogenase [Clostridium sp. Cult1]
MAKTITLIPGDGIGPEVISATVKIIDATGVNINWDKVEAGANTIETEGTPLPDYVIDSIKKNKVVLKGPITTPIGQGFRSVNVSLRKKLNLFANIRPIKSFDKVESLHKDVDLLIVRENTEDLYAGIERMIDEDRAESIKIITREASERICRYAFELAIKENRKKVTLVHKANIMKLSDGLFLESGRKIAKDYPSVEFEEMIVDAMSMKLVQFPQEYDVIVAPNLYGDILSDLSAGLIGGLGLAPGVNIGEEVAIFEPVHGSALDIANKNIANPTSAILSGVLMLKHIGEYKAATKIEEALQMALKDKESRTLDIDGKLGTKEFTEKIIEIMNR